MSRSLRIQFPGAIYHVTVRGNGRQAMVADDADRVRRLEINGNDRLFVICRIPQPHSCFVCPLRLAMPYASFIARAGRNARMTRLFALTLRPWRRMSSIRLSSFRSRDSVFSVLSA